MPDSFCGLLHPQCLAYDSASNTVFVSGQAGDCIIAIDGATNRKMARIPTDSNVFAIYYVIQNSNIYCANYGSRVTVIDGATNNVLRSIGVGDGPRAFAWNPVQNRVYVANYAGSSISVLRDSSSGIEDGPGPQASCFKPAATVVRGVLNLGVDSRQHTAFRAELLDATGRRVAALRPGANDVSRLAPGVYFVRQASGVKRDASNVRKVILTR
jgi:YVTN family beta-propeller protein